MTLKTALVAPTPRASDSTAVIARPGRRRNSRAAYRRSDASLSIHRYIRPDRAMVTRYFCSFSRVFRDGGPRSATPLIPQIPLCAVNSGENQPPIDTSSANRIHRTRRRDELRGIDLVALPFAGDIPPHQRGDLL